MSSVAPAYAQALFDVALEDNLLESVRADLQSLVQALKENPEARELLIYSQLQKEEKKKILKLALTEKAATILTNFLLVLIDKDRLNFLTEIEIHFRKLVNHHFGVMEGTISSAVPLTESQMEQLTSAFSKKFQGTVKLIPVVDPSLLGGYKVNLNDVVFDNTIKLQLKHLKKKLMNADLK